MAGSARTGHHHGLAAGALRSEAEAWSWPSPGPCDPSRLPGFLWQPLVGAIGALAAASTSLPGCPRMTGRGTFGEASRVCTGSPSRGAHPAPEKQLHLHKSCGSKGRGGSGSQSSRSVSSPSSSSSSSESSSSSSSSSSLASSLAMGFCRVARGSEPSTLSIEGNTWLCTGSEAWTRFNHDVSTAHMGSEGTRTHITRGFGGRHSSILAWENPRTEEGGLQSMGSQRVGHDWATNAHAHTLLTSSLRGHAERPVYEQ